MKRTRKELLSDKTYRKAEKRMPMVDNIPPEALKEGGPCTVDTLHRILNFAWEKEEIPDD